MKSIFNAVLSVVLAVSAVDCIAAEYPAELIGKYAKDCAYAKNMDGYDLFIERKNLSGWEFSCIAKKISREKMKFTITERCNSEDQTTTAVNTYEISGSKLLTKTQTLNKCS